LLIKEAGATLEKNPQNPWEKGVQKRDWRLNSIEKLEENIGKLKIRNVELRLSYTLKYIAWFSITLGFRENSRPEFSILLLCPQKVVKQITQNHLLRSSESLIGQSTLNDILANILQNRKKTPGDDNNIDVILNMNWLELMIGKSKSDGEKREDNKAGTVRFVMNDRNIHYKYNALEYVKDEESFEYFKIDTAKRMDKVWGMLQTEVEALWKLLKFWSEGEQIWIEGKHKGNDLETIKRN
jgi:hypothetical protein